MVRCTHHCTRICSWGVLVTRGKGGGAMEVVLRTVPGACVCACVCACVSLFCCQLAVSGGGGGMDANGYWGGGGERHCWQRKEGVFGLGLCVRFTVRVTR